MRHAESVASVDALCIQPTDIVVDSARVLQPQEPAQGLRADIYVVQLGNVPSDFPDGERKPANRSYAGIVRYIWRDTLPNRDGACEGDDISVCHHRNVGDKRSCAKHQLRRVVCG